MLYVSLMISIKQKHIVDTQIIKRKESSRNSSDHSGRKKRKNGQWNRKTAKKQSTNSNSKSIPINNLNVNRLSSSIKSLNG